MTELIENTCIQGKDCYNLEFDIKSTISESNIYYSSTLELPISNQFIEGDTLVIETAKLYFGELIDTPDGYINIPLGVGIGNRIFTALEKTLGVQNTTGTADTTGMIIIRNYDSTGGNKELATTQMFANYTQSGIVGSTVGELYKFDDLDDFSIKGRIETSCGVYPFEFPYFDTNVFNISNLLNCCDDDDCEPNAYYFEPFKEFTVHWTEVRRGINGAYMTNPIESSDWQSKTLQYSNGTGFCDLYNWNRCITPCQMAWHPVVMKSGESITITGTLYDDENNIIKDSEIITYTAETDGIFYMPTGVKNLEEITGNDWSDGKYLVISTVSPTISQVRIDNTIIGQESCTYFVFRDKKGICRSIYCDILSESISYEYDTDEDCTDCNKNENVLRNDSKETITVIIKRDCQEFVRDFLKSKQMLWSYNGYFQKIIPVSGESTLIQNYNENNVIFSFRIVEINEICNAGSFDYLNKMPNPIESGTQYNLFDWLSDDAQKGGRFYIDDNGRDVPIGSIATFDGSITLKYVVEKLECYDSTSFSFTTGESIIPPTPTVELLIDGSPDPVSILAGANQQSVLSYDLTNFNGQIGYIQYRYKELFLDANVSKVLVTAPASQLSVDFKPDWYGTYEVEILIYDTVGQLIASDTNTLTTMPVTTTSLNIYYKRSTFLATLPSGENEIMLQAFYFPDTYDTIIWGTSNAPTGGSISFQQIGTLGQNQVLATFSNVAGLYTAEVQVWTGNSATGDNFSIDKL